MKPYILFVSSVNVCVCVYIDTHTHTYINTYLLTPWSRVLLEKLTGFAANQEIPRILWNNPKVHHRTHKRPPCLYPEPSPSSPKTPSHFLKIHLNITLQSMSWSPQWHIIKYITLMY